ncbi:hypothetical protein C0J52_21925 [Blattella germanica]|nr:hypothetical protein C0J52_21925 [Blattella germanica]
MEAIVMFAVIGVATLVIFGICCKTCPKNKGPSPRSKKSNGSFIGADEIGTGDFGIGDDGGGDSGGGCDSGDGGGCDSGGGGDCDSGGGTCD